MKAGGLLFLIAAISFHSSAALAAPRQPKGEWKVVECPETIAEGPIKVTCGRLTIPEDYDDPSSGKVVIAAMVVHSPSTHKRTDPVLFINGGPGGISLASFEPSVQTPFMTEMLGDRDWIFFDQRGTGRSQPVLLCDDPPGDPMRYVPIRIIKQCRDKLIRAGIDLSQYNSVRIADDVEALRQALGYRQWNLYGSSFGSRVAMTIAHYYPESVRTLIQDAAYLPDDQATVTDMRGTEVTVLKLFDRCKAVPICARRYPNSKSRLYATLRDLARRPIHRGDRVLDDKFAANAIRDFMFGGGTSLVPQHAVDMLAFVDAAARRDAERMIALVDGPHPPAGSAAPTPIPAQPKRPETRFARGQQLSVDCNEERPFESMQEFAQAGRASPLIAALLSQQTNSFLFCSHWPAGRADPVENEFVDYQGPQLVFSGEFDASLSPLTGEKIVRLYRKARNIVFKTSAHTQLRRGTKLSDLDEEYRRCAARLAAAFFDNPSARLDARCAATHKLELAPLIRD